ncbi:hypothetical protein LAZ40_14375 [Cereibacter sphaeroides]|uniref:hypothetical protein n=1 Tax=Rhodobacterales TaxID=204455 RepID=UPI000BBE5B96|nr:MULTISPECIES: hypothetical protein [Paracoccaceae]MCE6951733.1 hypothetical protein [Cereibacter sphaeroides]MCE6960210.1 hypothetical protein [Cereibacter sphaeroides]MCE6969230.1 hypothetical protein [Cereibacter sphaeroides]MCE6974821.1 hypothetical protein [Cereibacter sphaeroides]
MIVTRNGRTYSSTLCRHLNQPCRQGLAMMEHLAQSVGQAGGAIQPGFEMQGCVRLEGCSRPCTALFRVTSAELHLFCDLEPSDWSPDLLRLADLLTGTGKAGWPARPMAEPAALVVASAAEAPGLALH